MSDTSGYPGQQNLSAWNNLFNAISFLVRQSQAQATHIALVQVKSVIANSVSGAPPLVTVQPMVAQMDQTGVTTPHGILPPIPTFRLQSGSWAFVIDPQEGDIGVVVCADRDISSAISNQAPSNPGSFRRFDWADALYFGGFGSVNPTDFVKIDSSGVTVTTVQNVTINATSGNVLLNSSNVQLGGAGGAAVARVGDTVSGGVITSGSSKVTAA